MTATNRGRFIVFEGIDGAGKSTQIALLGEKLQAAGRRVYCTAEPTESVSGGLLRDALGGVSKRTTCELAAMFVLDRIFHNVNPIHGIEKMLAEDAFVEHSAHAANYYGTPKAQLEEKLKKGDVILDIEPNGAFQVQAVRSDAILIFIMPPSIEELYRRLSGRGDT